MRDLVGSWSRRPPASLLAACAFAMTLWPQLAAADAKGVFSGFAGEWRGVGTVFGANGKSEALRCTESNVVSDDNISLTQSLVCVSSHVHVEFQTALFTDGHTVRGTLQDVIRKVGGNVYGQIADGVIAATITAPGVRARLSAKVSAGRQQVTIEPDGGQIARAVVTMKK